MLGWVRVFSDGHINLLVPFTSGFKTPSPFSIPQSLALSGQSSVWELVPVLPLSHFTKRTSAKELERKKRRDYHAGAGRGLKKSSVDYLPPKKKKKSSQNHQQSMGSKTCRRKKKGISVGVVGAGGAKLPRM